MKVELEAYFIDLIIETIQYRIDNDEKLEYHPNVRSDLEDLLSLLEDEYV